MHIYCPQCEYAPTEADVWQCDCGHEWNTFATRAKCPACCRSYDQTLCLNCSEMVDHEQWYHARPPVGFIHACEKCRKLVGRERFPQPTRRRQRVVRYLTAGKYERLLRDSGIYCARLDQFQDRHEGSLPRPIVGQADQIERLGLQQDEEGRRLWTKQFYVSCWHAAEEESDAMWQSYCGKGNGVCIVSTYERLSKLETGANMPMHLGLVTYIDYRKQSFAFRDSSAPMMHKRREFAHEKEVRLVISTVCEFLLVSRDTAKKQLDARPLGRRVRCDLSKLVTKVLVSPYADSKYFDEVVAFTRRYEPSLAKRIAWSRMCELPSF